MSEGGREGVRVSQRAKQRLKGKEKHGKVWQTRNHISTMERNLQEHRLKS